MSPRISTASERTRTRTIYCLERLVADSTKPAVMRRAATLRLGRLRAAAGTAKPLTFTTKPTEPAPTSKACIEAYESFIALSRQRRALFNKRRTPGEQEIFKAMIALMPSAAPQDNDPKAWRNFIAQVDGVLAEIKAAKLL